MKFLYLDIDGVLAVGYKKPKQTAWGYVEKWDSKCVSVLNEITGMTGAEIIVSSDWKLNFTKKELDKIFKWQGASGVPLDVTPDLGRRVLQTLELDRAKEILMHVEKHKPEAWVAVDDLDLTKYLDGHFVHLSRWMEGIKQSSKSQKIIQILNGYQK